MLKLTLAFAAGAVAATTVIVRSAPKEIGGALGWKLGELIVKTENKILGVSK